MFERDRSNIARVDPELWSVIQDETRRQEEHIELIASENYASPGIRLGSPAITTRGFRDEQARATATLIADVLDSPRDEANLATVRARVAKLAGAFPVYR